MNKIVKILYNIIKIYNNLVNKIKLFKKTSKFITISLYNISFKYLKFIKEYINNYIKKNFIILSFIYYTLLVLFTKKSSRG